MVFAVLERNHIAIRGVSENLEHLAGKNPVVSMQNSRPRFDDDACHDNQANIHPPTWQAIVRYAAATQLVLVADIVRFDEIQLVRYYPMLH